MRNPPILVLGATGRIGTILRRVWPAGRALWQSRAAGPGVAQIDPLGDPAVLARAAAGGETILCLSGVVPGRAGRMADNIALGLAAVRAARPGARVLLASSAAVYGRAPGPLPETAAPAPETEYARAKLAMETEAGALGADRGVAVTALRIGNIAGIDAILGGWRPGFDLDRFTDGRTPRRSYIGPATLARVLLALCDSAAPLPPVLNVAAPGLLEMGALLDAAGLAWAPRPAPPAAIPEVALDVALLGGFCPFDPRDSLAATMVAEWRALSETEMKPET